MAAMPARLTNDDGVFDRICACNNVMLRDDRHKDAAVVPLNATCVFRSSAFRFASGVMLSVIKHTEHRGSAR